MFWLAGVRQAKSHVEQDEWVFGTLKSSHVVGGSRVPDAGGVVPDAVGGVA